MAETYRTGMQTGLMGAPAKPVTAIWPPGQSFPTSVGYWPGLSASGAIKPVSLGPGSAGVVHGVAFPPARAKKTAPSPLHGGEH